MPEESKWPWFLAPVRGVLERVRAPEGEFDPAGAWQHRYSVCVLAPERGAKGEHPQRYGSLMLARKPGASGRFTLDVDLSILTRARSGMRNRATLTCAADRLATPLQWELRCDEMEQDKPRADCAYAETAEVRERTLVRRGRVERKTPVPGPFSSNWSLLEAVQRLPFDAPAVAFDMFEDLDLLKPGQTIHPAPAVTVPVGGRPVRLRVFRQVGRGILPTHYWLDEQHRLLAAAGGLRALVWEGMDRA